jgi:uncharacterized membrane protein
VFGLFGVMIAWATLNTFVLPKALHHKTFDPYPDKLMNLFLSMLAGVQAAALLRAAKRADAISSEIALHTEENTDDIKALLRENTELVGTLSWWEH